MTPGEAVTLLSYAVGALVFWWAARQRKMSTEGIWIVVAVAFVAGIFGAKLTELVAEGWPFRIPASAALDPHSGGRALIGGLVFGWIGVEVTKWRLGIRRSTGDLFALALPAGEGVGRIGCYLNGCCYGAKSNVPWAVWQHGAWRHPAQLYSAVVAALLFLFLLWMRGRVQREGVLFRLYLVGFGISRFALEFVRWRESVFFGLSPMQWFCLEIVVVVVIGTLVARRRQDDLELPGIGHG